MRVLISESQLNDLIILIEENGYHNYDNISDKQKSDFGRVKAGYGIKTAEPIAKKPKKYVELWKWKSGLITNFPKSWELYKTFRTWGFAEHWLKDNTTGPSDRKNYKIVQK